MEASHNAPEQEIIRRQVENNTSTGAKSLPIGVIIGITVACSAVLFSALTYLLIRYEVVFRRRRDTSNAHEGSEEYRHTPERTKSAFSHTPTSSQQRRSRNKEASPYSQFKNDGTPPRSKPFFGWKSPWSKSEANSKVTYALEPSTKGGSPSLMKTSISDDQHHAAITSFESPSRRNRLTVADQYMSHPRSSTENSRGVHRRPNRSQSPKNGFVRLDDLANSAVPRWPDGTKTTQDDIAQMYRAESVNSSVFRMFSSSQSGLTLPRSAGSMSATSSKNAPLETQEEKSPHQPPVSYSRDVLGRSRAMSRSSSVIDPTLTFSLSGAAANFEPPLPRGGYLAAAKNEYGHIIQPDSQADRRLMPDIMPSTVNTALAQSRWRDRNSFKRFCDVDQSGLHSNTVILEEQEENPTTTSLHSSDLSSSTLGRHLLNQNPTTPTSLERKELPEKRLPDLPDAVTIPTGRNNRASSNEASVTASFKRPVTGGSDSNTDNFSSPTRKSSLALNRRQSRATSIFKGAKDLAHQQRLPINPFTQATPVIQSNLGSVSPKHASNTTKVGERVDMSDVPPPLPLRLRKSKGFSKTPDFSGTTMEQPEDISASNDGERSAGGINSMNGLARSLPQHSILSTDDVVDISFPHSLVPNTHMTVIGRQSNDPDAPSLTWAFENGLHPEGVPFYDDRAFLRSFRLPVPDSVYVNPTFDRLGVDMGLEFSEQQRTSQLNNWAKNEQISMTGSMNPHILTHMRAKHDRRTSKRGRGGANIDDRWL